MLGTFGPHPSHRHAGCGADSDDGGADSDASGVAVAAILTQPDDDGQQHPVAYESCKLTAAERSYPAHVLELLAVVHAMRVFKHYLRLLGSKAPRPLGCRSAGVGL